MRWQLYTVGAARSLSVTDCFIWQTFVRGCKLPNICLILVFPFVQLVYYETGHARHLSVCQAYTSVGRRHVELVSEDTAVDSRWERDKWSTFVQVSRSHDVKSSAECLSNASVVGTRLDYFVMFRQAMPTPIPACGSPWPSAQYRATCIYLGSFHSNPSSSF
jgi:hypothetical protein